MSTGKADVWMKTGAALLFLLPAACWWRLYGGMALSASPDETLFMLSDLLLIVWLPVMLLLSHVCARADWLRHRLGEEGLRRGVRVLASDGLMLACGWLLLFLVAHGARHLLAPEPWQAFDEPARQLPWIGLLAASVLVLMLPHAFSAPMRRVGEALQLLTAARLCFFVGQSALVRETGWIGAATLALLLMALVFALIAWLSTLSTGDAWPCRLTECKRVETGLWRVRLRPDESARSIFDQRRPGQRVFWFADGPRGRESAGLMMTGSVDREDLEFLLDAGQLAALGWERLEDGAAIWLGRPQGEVCPDAQAEENLVLFAEGDRGVLPFLSAVRTAADEGALGTMTLVWFHDDARQHPAAAEWPSLTRRLPFNLVHVVPAGSLGRDLYSMARKGHGMTFIEGDFTDQHVWDHVQGEMAGVYLCGSPTFCRRIRRQLGAVLKLPGSCFSDLPMLS